MAGLAKSQVLVLIPAYNEEKNVSRVASEAKSLGFPTLVVDDGSSDGTAEEIKRIGVDILTTDVNQGKGAASRRGFEWFLTRNYEALVMMDADGQHDPKELDLFVEALQNSANGMIVGDRMANPRGMPWIRRATNRFMSWILSAIAGQRIPDSQCGYRALKRGVVEKMELRTTRFEIESEILLEAARLGFPIGSVPIQCVYANEHSSIHPFRDTVRFFKFLFQYLTRRHPSHTLGLTIKS